MNNLQLIKEACYKANPEIKELKFGCEIVAKKSNKTLTVAGQYEGDPLVLDYFTGFPQVVVVDGYMNTDLVEILGRPIRLADVLFMIGKTKHVVAVDTDGDFIEATPAEWNLLDDNLDHQSQETLQFIGNLLN